MLYVTALRYSEPYFSQDVSLVEHVLRNKDEGSCTMTHNICFFLDWKPPKQLKCAYTQPIPHTNKNLSSLIAL